MPQHNFTKEEDKEQEIQELKERIEKLEDILENHQHLGLDGSKEFSGGVSFRGKEFIAESRNIQESGIQVLPFVALDPEKGIEKKRGAGMGIAVASKGESGEVSFGILEVAKMTDDKDIPTALNRADFEDDVNNALVSILYFPQSSYFVSAGSLIGPSAQLVAYRTPVIVGATGKIVQGESTLKDPTANFTENQLMGAIIEILKGGVQQESYRVLGNTKDTITAGEYNYGDIQYASWVSESGDYDYQIVSPALLGSPSYPFTRLYVSDDIRMGLGSSGGSQVRYMKWGVGTPEGLVTANIGSMYLRFDGGANTTLYIKESGTGNTGWVAK